MSKLGYSLNNNKFYNLTFKVVFKRDGFALNCNKDANYYKVRFYK